MSVFVQASGSVSCLSQVLTLHKRMTEVLKDADAFARRRCVRAPPQASGVRGELDCREMGLQLPPGSPSREPFAEMRLCLLKPGRCLGFLHDIESYMPLQFV